MIRIERSIVEAIRTEALDAFPNEGCGLLIGVSTEDGWTVARAEPSPNLMAPERSDRFEIDPVVRLRVEREIRGTREAVIGVWHSHPDGSCEPSATDLAQVFEPELVWLIIGVREGRIQDERAWKPSDDVTRFDGIEIELT